MDKKIIRSRTLKVDIQRNGQKDNLKRTLKVDIQRNGQKDNQKPYIEGGHTTQWTKRKRT